MTACWQACQYYFINFTVCVSVMDTTTHSLTLCSVHYDHSPNHLQLSESNWVLCNLGWLQQSIFLIIFSSLCYSTWSYKYIKIQAHLSAMTSVLWCFSLPLSGGVYSLWGWNLVCKLKADGIVFTLHYYTQCKEFGFLLYTSLWSSTVYIVTGAHKDRRPDRWKTVVLTHS